MLFRSSPLAKATGDITANFVAAGTDAAASAASNVGKFVTNNVEDIKTITAIKMTEQAVSGLTGESVNYMARVLGGVVNPNLELLFSGPQLRDFSFMFKMSPRSEKEAIAIKTIIRYFKQAMSAKRTKSNLLLKTPHTFRISYMSGTEDHPYLKIGRAHV